jgi:hypothetical protein
VEDLSQLCRAKNIVPFFFLQPNIYTVNPQLLTAREQEILNKRYADCDVPRLFRMVYQKISSSPALQGKNFYDLRDVLNAAPREDHFSDNCHLFNNGNKIVAAQIFALLQKHLPADYQK